MSDTMEIRESLIIITRGFDNDDLIIIAESMIECGLHYLEVTVDTPGAINSIETLTKRFSNKELNVGAGTVKNLKLAKAAFDAGAKFIVSPILDEEVISTFNEKCPVIPGVFTPTEIERAIRAGAKYVKIFPISIGGENHLKEIRVIFNDVKILVTGGVTTTNIPILLQAGADLVGIGGSIFTKYKGRVKENKHEIKKEIKKVAEIVKIYEH